MGSVLSVEDRVQEGHVGQVNLNAAQIAAEAMSQLGMATRVEIRFSCRGLPRKDTLSKSDPMVVLYSSAATGQTQWSELGRTNVVANTADPDFVHPVLARYSAEGQPQPMRVVVYDVDKRAKRPEALSLAGQDYLGEAEFMMSEVMSAPGQRLELQLLDLANGRQLPPSCVVVLKAEAMAAQDTRVVRMAFSATGLAKKDVMSQSDPFLAALKRRPIGGENDWVPVFKTEVRNNNSDPLWQPIEVDIRQLCGADEKLPLKLQVWDFDTNGHHDLIGELQTSLGQLKEAAATPAKAGLHTLDLVAPPSKKKGGAAGGKPGTIVIRQIMIRDGPTPQQQLFGCFQACMGEA